MDKHLSIAFFSRDLPSDAPNGVSCQVHRLANELTALGNHVTCFSFSSKPAGALYEHRKLTYNTSSRFLRLFETAWQFSKVNTSDFDILHYHGDDYLCAGSARRVRTFYGSALHEAWFAKKILRKIRQLIFYKLEWLSCLRKGTKVGISLTTAHALPLIKTIIPCGVPLSRYTPGGSKTLHPSILFIGDLDSRKRGRLLVRVFTKDIMPLFPTAKLTVVGPQLCEGKGIIYKKDMAEDELICLYRSAWLYCCPSSYEGFGVPLCEAMACGTAVVSCVNNGSCDIISHEANGMLCTAQTLGKTIRQILSDTALRSTLIEAGLLFVKQFSSTITAQQYETLYENILATMSRHHE